MMSTSSSVYNISISMALLNKRFVASTQQNMIAYDPWFVLCAIFSKMWNKLYRRL